MNDRWAGVSAPTKTREGDQVLPNVNGERDCQSRLVERINDEVPKRREVGIQRYGTALQPFNGRDALRDLWEELLDASTYFQQVEVEFKALVGAVQKLVDTATGDEANAHWQALREAERLLATMGVLERGLAG